MTKDEQQAYDRQYYQEHTAEIKAYQAQYYLSHRQKVIDRRMRYYNEHRDQERIAQAKYREDHHDGLREYAAEYYKLNRDERRLARAIWQAAHQPLMKESKRRHHARQTGAKINDLTNAQWQERKAEYGSLCAYCLKPMGTVSQDHMTPLSRGGDHTLTNVVPACRSCNSLKGTKTLLEFVTNKVVMTNGVNFSVSH